MDVTMAIDLFSIALLLFACIFLLTRQGVSIKLDSYVASEDGHIRK